jgi:hypothetical protein
MDDELKRYLDNMAANIITAIPQMESRIMSELESPPARLDAVARKLEGEEKEEVPAADATRIEAGH